MSDPLRLDRLGIKENEHSCWNCKNLYPEKESWEMAWIYEHACSARPQNARLKQFPFRVTTCSGWEKDEPHKVP